MGKNIADYADISFMKSHESNEVVSVVCAVLYSTNDYIIQIRYAGIF